MASLKRKTFSIKEKMSVVHRLQAGESTVPIVNFGIRHSTISASKIEACFDANALKIKRLFTMVHAAT